MSLRFVQVTADAKHFDALRAVVADAASVIHFRISAEEEGERTLFMLVGPQERQHILDRIQACLGSAKDWRIVVLPVEAVIPQPEQSPEAVEVLARAEAIETREELYHEVEAGARGDMSFLLLTGLSTVVAAIGLIRDNVAVVIGAMVIAPLLGPNLALILGIALGDRELMLRAARTSALGFGLALALAVLIGLLIPIDMDSRELAARTAVGLDGIALALASGAAAALSLTTGLSSALVGVMVAVALLPPAAAVGLLLGTGEAGLAFGAALLLAANVICLNLAGQIVFLFQGVKPRTWLEKRSAHQSVVVSLVVWALCLAVLVAVVIVLRAPTP